MANGYRPFAEDDDKPQTIDCPLGGACSELECLNLGKCALHKEDPDEDDDD